MARLHGLLLCVVLVGLSGPAVAWLNDNETSTHEREFRSQYGGLASVRAMAVDEFLFQRPVSIRRQRPATCWPARVIEKVSP
jgi:hypothetical protein